MNLYTAIVNHSHIGVKPIATAYIYSHQGIGGITVMNNGRYSIVNVYIILNGTI